MHLSSAQNAVAQKCTRNITGISTHDPATTSIDLLVSLQMETMLNVLESAFGHFSDSRFRSIFGVSVETVVFLWHCILHVEDDIGIHLAPIHLLWTLHFLKTYPTTPNGAYFWRVDAKTYRHHIWKFILVLLCYLDTISVDYLFSHGIHPVFIFFFCSFFSLLILFV